jgi:glycerate dehydrogenase
MKIVVLDSDPAFGSAAAPEDASGRLDAAPLSKFGDLFVYPNTSAEQLEERAQDAVVVLTNKIAIGAPELAKMREARLISVLATGVNMIDLDAAADRGVTVCNVPGYSTMSTAQHTIALLLELCNHVGLHASDVASGSWEKAEAFSYFRAPLRELDGQKLGIVGYGAIGQQVAKVASALGMEILVHTRTQREADGVRFVDKGTLLLESDVVSLHCPLTEETHHFIDEDALGAMKPSALLLNASRGPVVDEAALARALSDGTILGAATDVLSTEPPEKGNPLLSAPRCLITPHIAWATEAARARLIAISARNIEAFLNGTPQNVVG